MPAEQKFTFETLNGMRGIAAICVVFVHESGLFSPMVMRSGALAVDFFFVLSGFVLTAAYAPRLNSGMAVRAFFVMRYMRFYPLAILGIALGAVSTAALIITQKSSMDAVSYGVAVVASLLLLPMPLPNFGLYPLDGPLWSLFIELVANVVFAAVWLKLSRSVLVGILAVGFVMLVPWAIVHGDTNAGYAWDSVLGGFIRVTFDFFAGVLIFKVRSRNILLPSWMAPVLFVVLVLVLSNEIGPTWLYDLVCTGLLLPSIVWLGGSVEWNPKGISAFLGRISFPLYVIHVPFFSLVSGSIAIILGHSIALTGAPWSGLFILLVAIGAAYCLDRWYDAPIRRLLASHRSQKAALAATEGLQGPTR